MALTPKSEQAAELYIRRHSLIDEMDDVVLFTWNPNDYFMKGTRNYNDQWLKMTAILSKFKRCARNYAFVAEVSPTGRLHCHGFYVLQDKVKFVKGVIPHLKANGFIYVNPAKSHDMKAFKYHLEDLNDTVRFIEDFPVVFTKDTYDIFMKRLTYIALKYGCRQERKKQKRSEKHIAMVGRMVGLDVDDLDSCEENQEEDWNSPSF